jgi:dihydroorotase (multifunctional complex type)
MTSADLALSGRIVLPEGISQGTIVVKNGQIQGIVELTAKVDTAVQLDCDRYFILPGVVDSHVHFRDPGSTHKEDFETGTSAAAAGGVTTVMDMPNTEPWVTSAEIFNRKMKLLKGRSNVDFALEAVACPGNISMLSGLNACRAVSFEAFTADVPEALLMNDDFILFEALKTVANLNGIMGFYLESQSFWEHLVPQLKASGRNDAEAFGEAKSPLSEATMMTRVISLNQAAKCNVVLRQVSTQLSADIVSSYKQRGVPIYVEVTPHNLLLTNHDLKRLKCFAKISPPLRSSQDVNGLWAALGRGTVDMISTDHSPHTAEEKARDEIWECPGGFPGVETSLPLMLDQVSRGRLDLPKLALLMSTNPAKIFGLYPRKGVLRPGSQADIAVVDLHREWEIRGSDLHSKCGWTPFEGRKVKGAIKYTVLSGKIIAEDSELTLKKQGLFVIKGGHRES